MISAYEESYFDEVSYPVDKPSPQDTRAKNSTRPRDPPIRMHQLHPGWNSMMRRCTNKNDPAYNRYGGRGISVCERWRNFKNFAADMGKRPAGHSLDRIDNDSNYEPANCRWATAAQQSRNRHDTVRYEHGGERLTSSEWAERTGVERYLVHERLWHGWPLVDAVTTPNGAKRTSALTSEEDVRRRLMTMA